MDLEEFISTLPEPGPWKPNWHLNKDGCQIEVYLENVPHYGVYKNPQVTELRAEDDQRLIGVVLTQLPSHFTDCEDCGQAFPYHKDDCDA